MELVFVSFTHVNYLQPRYAAAQNVFEDFQSSYADAVEHVRPHTRVSKPKFRGTEHPALTVKPVQRINVVVCHFYGDFLPSE